MTKIYSKKLAQTFILNVQFVKCAYMNTPNTVANATDAATNLTITVSGSTIASVIKTTIHLFLVVSF